MDAILRHDSMLALFNLGAGEIILILALILILFEARKFPDLTRGLGRGIDEFGKATREVKEELDQGAFDAGESIGGIYGRPAAEALTPDNQVAELYNPAVLAEKRSPDESRRRWYRGILGVVKVFGSWLIEQFRALAHKFK